MIVFQHHDRCQQWLHAATITINQLRQFLTLWRTQLRTEIALYMYQNIRVIAARCLMRHQMHQVDTIFICIIVKRAPPLHAGNKTTHFAVFLLSVRQQQQLVTAVKSHQFLTCQAATPQRIELIQRINTPDKMFTIRLIMQASVFLKWQLWHFLL